jgi:TetR/AcrR family transcriptional regulator, mexJK operon transcriptional repressor
VTDAPPAPVEPGRSARKRAAILDAATTVFLRNGYVGTSMDEVATAAAVSKQTVYKHFADKERLFTEIILGTIDQVGDPLVADIESVPEVADLAGAITEIGRRLIGVVMQPQVLQLRRLVTAEADRFPELGRAYYERGPERTIAVLTTWFERLVDQRLLQADDPRTAAQHLLWLVVSIPLNKAMLCGTDEPFPPADLERIADDAVRAFLAAYRRPTDGRRKPTQHTPR